MPYLLNNLHTFTLTLDPSQEIGSGGMGVVYRIGNVLGNGKLVAKIFKNPADPKNPSKAKLQAMIDRPPEHIYEVINGVGYTQFAWVQNLIFEDDGTLIGYAMPELDFDRSLSLNPFMYPREAERLTDYQNSLNYRVQLGANISALMADLHAHGHAFIDFKEQNLRLLPEPKTGVDDDYKGFIVGFVDCDSFRVTGKDGTVYPSPVISPEMTSPEYHDHKDISRLDEKHDRFVLAIELFKILNYGIHPFYFIPLSERLKNASHRNTDQFIKERLYAYGIAPHPEIAPLKNSIHQCWDDTTRQLFDKAFLSLDPNDRPTAQAWEDHFRSLIDGRYFTVCDNFPNEISHIHFVGKPCHRCLWQAASNPSGNPSSNSPSSSVWQNPPTQPIPTQSPTTSPWQSVSTETVPPPVQAVQKPTVATSGKQISPHHASLEQNRAWEQSLNQQTKPQSTPITPTPVQASQPASQPAVPTAETVEPVAPVSSESPINERQTDNSETVTLATPVGTETQSNKKSKKWLIPIMAGVLGIGGYALTHQKSTSNSTSDTPAQNDTTDNTATAVGDTTDSKTGNTATAYQTAINDLPQAKANIDKALSSSGGLFGRSASSLYQDTLGISPEFFSQVQSVAKQGKSDLNQLINTANTHDSQATNDAAIQAFRGADMGYFAKQKTNTRLARQFNEAAKNYYWNKKDPKSALYLQAQAVKNSPNQGEYVANLAFYLFKNNYPNAKDFVLYALQTPRAERKLPNTYMIELASALAVKDGDRNKATGALLAQYYTADDRAKRCQNMLRYPVTYPELVPIAEQVFITIDEQNTDGETAPNVCLPPLNWAN